MLHLCFLPFLLQAPAPPPPPPVQETRTEYEVFYHHKLKNRTQATLKEVIVYVPVPESDAYQEVREFRIERDRPVRISNRTDAYGTRIKRLEIADLEPGAEIDVGFSCVVSLGAPPRIELDASKASETTPEDLARFTKDHSIFGLKDPSIRSKAAELLAAHPHPVERALAIHDFVASSLKYDGGGGWDPAPVVLGRRSGSCSEFSYLFCALSRATGLPTRFVGASIFPAKSAQPFHDHGHHRWAEVWLPGHGWVPFDPTLDRGKKPKRDFAGSHHGRTLVLTRIGSKSLQLGLSYVGANTDTGETTRSRVFVWSQGTRARLASALDDLAAGREEQGRGTLRDLTVNWAGTRAAREAQAKLTELDAAAAAKR
jgi:transglutaminase-like putative cysteine protease